MYSTRTRRTDRLVGLDYLLATCPGCTPHGDQTSPVAGNLSPGICFIYVRHTMGHYSQDTICKMPDDPICLYQFSSSRPVLIACVLWTGPNVIIILRYPVLVNILLGHGTRVDLGDLLIPSFSDPLTVDGCCCCCDDGPILSWLTTHAKP